MSLINIILCCFIWLQCKHFILDWVWQPEYEHKNKGNIKHPGGYIHAFKHAIGTGLVFLYFFPRPFTLLVFPLDFAIHYVIDWCKVNTNRHYGLDPKVHPEFWWLTGFDQFMHQLTYILLMGLVVSHIYS